MKHLQKTTYKTQLHVLHADEGKSIEEEIRQALATKQPIEQSAPIIYTEKKDGVLPQFDPRTDRFDLALDATNQWDKSIRAETENTPTTNNDKKEE